MDPRQWVSARDALNAMLVKKGMPPNLAGQAADQLISVAGPPNAEAGTRYLVLLQFQFSAEPRHGEYWISRQQFERALAAVESDPSLSGELPSA
jgi:hypothetical protein